MNNTIHYFDISVATEIGIIPQSCIKTYHIGLIKIRRMIETSMMDTTGHLISQSI